MLQIYKPNDCPQWVKKKCEKETETTEGTKYTFYSGYGTEILYYIVYKDRPLSAVIHVLLELEEQEYKHGKLHTDKSIKEDQEREEFKKGITTMQLLFYFFLGICFIFTLIKPIIRKLFYYLSEVKFFI